MATQWMIRSTDADLELMSRTLGLSKAASAVLANRGVRSKNAALQYLNPVKRYMHDPGGFEDIDKAAGIIAKHLPSSLIAIYGDYDVDGVTSTAILYKTFKAFSANVIYYIPHREEEGYGLNLSAVERLRDMGVNLLVTCDNGISAGPEIEAAKTMGMDVIVIDHHEPPFEDIDGNKRDIIPPADAVIDPKRQSCGYPFKSLCAGGICYKVSQYLHQYFNKPFDLDNELLALAAIATFCDVVDLVGENRIIAKNGLVLINAGLVNNVGLRSLIKKRELANKPIGGFEIGFIIGPCINATGRLESAKYSVELFLTEDLEYAETLSEKLKLLNDERKSLTAKAADTALEQVKNGEYDGDKVLVMYMPQVHESIAGIVAGRVKEKLNKPAMVITKSGGMAKGSARSIEGYNIFEELSAFKSLFTRFGGHAMAAGFSLAEENIPALRQGLNENCRLTQEDFSRKLFIDGELDLREVTYQFAEEMACLEPFGKANPEPLFLSRGVISGRIDCIGGNKTSLRITYPAGSHNIKGLYFSRADDFMEMLREKYGGELAAAFYSGRNPGLTIPMDIVYHININEYQGNRSVQLRIEDMRFC